MAEYQRLDFREPPEERQQNTLPDGPVCGTITSQEVLDTGVDQQTEVNKVSDPSPMVHLVTRPVTPLDLQIHLENWNIPNNRVDPLLSVLTAMI